MGLSEYEQKLLDGWEDVHKKGQLTLWVLLSLKNNPKHMQEIKQSMSDLTGGTIEADDKSMYRALRRFNEADLICYEMEPSESGPDHKMYRLTDTGQRVLAEFIERNISGVYYDASVRKLLED